MWSMWSFHSWTEEISLHIMWLSSNNKGHLTRHKKSVHQGFKYPCTICGYKASRSSSLNEHIQSKHKGKKYQCNSCDKEYSNSPALRYHHKSVHEGVIYNCNICHSTFTQKSDLSKHIKSVHFRVRYQCKICNYQATLKNSLSRHVKNVHKKSENINCSECNKSIQRDYLKQHIKMFHSGEQTLYNCIVCTYQSICQSDVNRHVRNVHQKSEKITCSECNKSIQKDYLKKHMKVFHSVE